MVTTGLARMVTLVKVPWGDTTGHVSPRCHSTVASSAHPPQGLGFSFRLRVGQGSNAPQAAPTALFGCDSQNPMHSLLLVLQPELELP